jgi:hypothetical protein
LLTVLSLHYGAPRSPRAEKQRATARGSGPRREKRYRVHDHHVLSENGLERQISSMNSCRSGSAYIAPWHALLADGMEGGHRDGAQPFDERGAGLDRRSVRKFAAAIGIERLLRDDLARYGIAKPGLHLAARVPPLRRQIARPICEDLHQRALERNHHPPPPCRCHCGGLTKTSPER